MKQFPNNPQFPRKLTTDDLRTYRRWTGGLYLTYLAAIIVAIGLVLANGPARDPNASNEVQMARLKGGIASTDIPATTKPATKP